MAMTCWKALLARAQENNKDTTPIVFCTLDEVGLNQEFDSGFGCEEGQPFTAWSETHVYFPLSYDGSEWVGSAPRNPCDKALSHQGG